ncbi:MAG: histidine phosphatase family protein [Aggregatilineales bacterium]
MPTKRVILIRPGETEWNKIGRIQGQAAIPLNGHGLEQAHRMAKFLRPIAPGTLYASDTRRAKEAAEIIAETLNVSPVYDERLRERHMGEWQGLSLNEIKSWFSDDFAGLRNNSIDYQIPGGEAWKQVAERVQMAFEDILKQDDSETIAIITHTTAIRALINDLVEDANTYLMEFSNMSATTLAENADGGWHITQLNDISHLDGMGTRSVIEVEDLRHDSGY